jgi:hypothetical protein
MQIREPSIRGAALRQSIDWLGQLIVTRCTTFHALGVRLQPGDIALLSQPIDANGWYPVDRCARIDEALILAHGGVPAAVLRELGARRAARWVADRRASPSMGSRTAESIDPAKLFRDTPLLNFGRWRMHGDPLVNCELVLEEAEPLPESARISLAGFLQSIFAATVDREARVESRREEPDRALFRIRTL